MNRRNILVTLECFVKKDGKYLMLHRNPTKRIMPNVLMAPGGKREFNEGLFAAARREILEETGLAIKNIHIAVAGNAYMRDIDQELYFHLLTADYDGGEVRENLEDGQLVWLTPEEMLQKENLLSELRKVIPQLFTTKKVISYSTVYASGNNMIEFRLEES